VSLEKLLSDLSRSIPENNLLLARAQLAPYESDGLTSLSARPGAVVLVESEAQVVDVVKFCHKLAVPFVARGSGTSLSGGATPIPGGIVIALNRLNKILNVDPARRVAVVQPGVANLAVSFAASPYGLYYAPDPSSQPICTIGGNVAYNSGGAHCLKYGMTANHVLGLRVVLPDGEVAELGGSSLEIAGPDSVGFFVGCEGLFGIATEVTLRLVPKPEVYRTILASYDSLRAAGQAVSDVVASGLLPGAIEIMDSLAIEAAEKSVHAGYPQGAAAVLIVELDGEASQVELEFEKLHAVIEGSGATEFRIAADDAQRAQIWKGRKGAFSAVGRLAPNYIVQDGVVPREQLGAALDFIEKTSKQYGLSVANVFHAGDGNLHPLILYDGSEPGMYERAEELAGEITSMCIRLGGSLTGEHGIGLEKRSHMPEMFNPNEMDLMAEVRKSVDSNQIANRNKMLLVDIDAAANGHAVPTAQEALP
jgi:glycolate oxidase